MEKNIENKNLDTYWDSAIMEYEVDASWSEHPIYHSEKYKDYRKKWDDANKGHLVPNFPLNIEVEPTYYCNLKCPFCPRYATPGERQDQHMQKHIWEHIIEECKENNLPSMQMDHEAEAMMNPKFFEMLEDTQKAGILETWLHTNGMMLNEKNAKKLIQFGLKKINISIDANTKETYEKYRVGGKFDRVVNNVLNFLKIKEEMDASYLRVRLSFVEQEGNFSEKKGFYDFWSTKKGVNTITFQKCLDFSLFDEKDYDRNLSEKELDNKYKDEEPFFCSNPFETPIIREDGKVTPCGMPVREENEDFVVGDISKGDKIKDIWNGTKMKRLREKHRNNKWYTENMCRVCVKILRSAQHENSKI